MEDFLDKRSPGPANLFCTSPQEDQTSITPRYRYELQSSASGSRRKQHKDVLRPFTDPGAPHNTTEFLIEDKILHSDDLDFGRDMENNSVLVKSSFPLNDSASFEAGFKAYSSSEDEGLVLDTSNTSEELSSDSQNDSVFPFSSYDQEQFKAAYEPVSEIAESRLNLPRVELIATVKSLLAKLSVKSKQFFSSTELSNDVNTLQRQLDELLRANAQLREENSLLKSEVETHAPLNKKATW